MRPGQVCAIRVNPTDCMSVIDIVQKLGLYQQGMSFPQMTSIALSSMLESFRQAQAIPTRAGFEYNEMMAPYAGRGKNARAISITNAMQQMGTDVALKAAPIEVVEAPEMPHTAKPAELSLEQRIARTRLTELVSKKDLAEDGHPGVVWSAADEAEYHQVYRQVYPAG